MLCVMRDARVSAWKVIAIGHARPITRQGGAAQDGDGVPSKGGFNKGGDTKEYTLIVPSSVSGGLWSVLSDLPTVVTAGEEEWQTLRIKQGDIFLFSFEFPKHKCFPCVSRVQKKAPLFHVSYRLFLCESLKQKGLLSKNMFRRDGLFAAA